MVDLAAFFSVTNRGVVPGEMRVTYLQSLTAICQIAAMLVLSSTHLDYESSVGAWNVHRHIPGHRAAHTDVPAPSVDRQS